MSGQWYRWCTAVSGPPTSQVKKPSQLGNSSFRSAAPSPPARAWKGTCPSGLSVYVRHSSMPPVRSCSFVTVAAPAAA